ncbi:MAG: winged helix-turn-helix transcriptional regulator, partial [Fusobacteriaceae bacterium]
CPLEITCELIKGKWSPILLWRIRLGPQRLTELKAIIIDCNEKMLIDHLKILIKYGLIEKKTYDIFPKHTEYSLTDLGQKLLPILISMQSFGESYINSEVYQSLSEE